MRELVKKDVFDTFEEETESTIYDNKCEMHTLNTLFDNF